MVEEAVSCKKKDRLGASMPSLRRVRHMEYTNFVLKNAVDEAMDQYMLTFAV